MFAAYKSHVNKIIIIIIIIYIWPVRNLVVPKNKFWRRCVDAVVIIMFQGDDDDEFEYKYGKFWQSSMWSKATAGM